MYSISFSESLSLSYAQILSVIRYLYLSQSPSLCLYLYLSLLPRCTADIQRKTNPTLLPKSKGLNKTPYYHGALNSLRVTLIQIYSILFILWLIIFIVYFICVFKLG